MYLWSCRSVWGLLYITLLLLLITIVASAVVVGQKSLAIHCLQIGLMEQGLNTWHSQGWLALVGDRHFDSLSVCSTSSSQQTSLFEKPVACVVFKDFDSLCSSRLTLPSQEKYFSKQSEMAAMPSQTADDIFNAWHKLLRQQTSWLSWRQDLSRSSTYLD